jgi:hypothetical protein
LDKQGCSGSRAEREKHDLQGADDYGVPLLGMVPFFPLTKLGQFIDGFMPLQG